MFYRSAQLFLCSITPFILLYLFYPTAIDSIGNYIYKQVYGSIQNISSLSQYTPVDSRFFIIKKLILEFLPALVLCLIILFFSIRKKLNVELQENKFALFFILLALSGVLPVMVSMKQSGFYILTSFPFFSIALGILVTPFIVPLMPRKTFKLFVLGLLIVIVSILLSIKKIGVTGRDHDLIEDVQLLLEVIPEDSKISIDKDMRNNYSLVAYFARHANVSLNSEEKLNYHVSYHKKNNNLANYGQIKLNTKTLILYLKNK